MLRGADTSVFQYFPTCVWLKTSVLIPVFPVLNTSIYIIISFSNEGYYPLHYYKKEYEKALKYFNNAFSRATKHILARKEITSTTNKLSASQRNS